MIYTAPTDPQLAPQPNDCTIASAGSPAIYTLTAGTAPGTCTVIAWAGGTSIQLSVTVTTTIAIKNSQAIAFPAIAPKTYGDAAFIVTATASSGLPVTLSSTTPAVCTVSGSTVTIVSAGNCTISADQPGNASYLAAARGDANRGDRQGVAVDHLPGDRGEDFRRAAIRCQRNGKFGIDGVVQHQPVECRRLLDQRKHRRHPVGGQLHDCR